MQGGGSGWHGDMLLADWDDFEKLESTSNIHIKRFKSKVVFVIKESGLHSFPGVILDYKVFQVLTVRSTNRKCSCIASQSTSSSSSLLFSNPSEVHGCHEADRNRFRKCLTILGMSVVLSLNQLIGSDDLVFTCSDDALLLVTSGSTAVKRPDSVCQWYYKTFQRNPNWHCIELWENKKPKLTGCSSRPRDL